MQQNVTLGKRILIIDDDQSARESIKLLLNIDRHLVTEARDGSEALELIATQTFDLVLLDFFMPGMNGDEVARRIRQIAPSLPILMVSAYVEKLVGLDGPESTNAVLGKPFAVSALRGEITKLLPSGGQTTN
ncbi:MAG TPA: response regulator [Verrucomicrobiae bacterium]